MDTALFAAFPYVAVALAIAVGVHRWLSNRFSYSSVSSQFLENRALFWGSVPWHYGIIIILVAHITAVAIPGAWASLVSEPVRLYVLEVTGLALGLTVVLGIALLIARRVQNPRVFRVTTPMDWVLLGALLVQVGLGVWVALQHRWGAQWYLYTAVPWIVSLAKLRPEPGFVTSLPWIVKLHFLGGFVIIALLPFTRLVHLLSLPVAYLWRPFQVVIWNRRGNRPPAATATRSMPRESAGAATGTDS